MKAAERDALVELREAARGLLWCCNGMIAREAGARVTLPENELDLGACVERVGAAVAALGQTFADAAKPGRPKKKATGTRKARAAAETLTEAVAKPLQKREDNA